MLYRQKFDTFIRTYGDVGYITNKSKFNDQVTDKSGAIFLQALSRNPRDIEDIVKEIIGAYKNADYDEVKYDVIAFYKMLEEDGFIVSGETPVELDKKDIRFSYSELMPKTVKDDFTPQIFRADKGSQDYLENHFKHNPQLTQFQIELTSRCNERCLHCYIPHECKKGDIKPELFYDVLEQCSKMGVLSITFSGGEPMLHPEFIEFLRKAKEYDFSVNILSNLTLLNDDIINEMKANRLSSVQVSLYSMTPDIHDSITQVKGSFFATKKAIDKLIENDIPLQISCPVIRQNKNCYKDVAKWSKEHKIRAISDYIVMARYDNTTDNLDNRLRLEDVGEIIKDVIKMDFDYEERLIEANFNEIEKKDVSDEIVCGVCVSSICMVANGNVYPCAGWQNYVCGNLYKNTLKDIWDNSPKVKYLRNLRKKDFPECIKCEHKHFCAMCMVRNANEDPDGNPLKINKHFCDVAALNRKIVLEWKAELEAAK